MNEIPVSVIVVSRGRPDALKLCLTGIEQLFYENFELVVVSDNGGCEAVRGMGLDGAIKLIQFDEANISAARNLGISVANGDIIAFIDDDAVPEPAWLDHLIASFLDPTVSIAGGFVLGRDGLSYQYRANFVDQFGDTTPLEVHATIPQIFAPPPAGAIKIEGTNFAIKRKMLLDLGGFDEAFHYYLDETDLIIRAAKVGAVTAIVPRALVHHGFLASEHRTARSLPKTLFDIAASKVVFLKKHAGEPVNFQKIDALRVHQLNLLERHKSRGECTEADVERIIQTFDKGRQAAATRVFGQYLTRTKNDSQFQRFQPRQKFTQSVVMSGRIWNANKLRKCAKASVDSGKRTTLFLFSPTPRKHKARFNPEGFWEQTGGLWGQAGDRSGKHQTLKFKRREKLEISHLEDQRRFTKNG